MASSWIFKVIVAGAGGVGKTAMVTRYCTGKFEEGYKMTIGASFHTKSGILLENVDFVNYYPIIVKEPVVHLFVSTLVIMIHFVKFLNG